jgi:hypothetical protein
MMSAIRPIIASLLLGVAAASSAIAQGRNDHDTPATQDPSESGRQQYRAPDCWTGTDGWAMCRDRNGYWQRDRYDPDFKDHWRGDGGHGQGHGGGYGVMPPDQIARYLHQNNFTYISQPVLAGQFYQVKALDPYGRKVKLYIDAHTGRIAKMK